MMKIETKQKTVLDKKQYELFEDFGVLVDDMLEIVSSVSAIEAALRDLRGQYDEHIRGMAVLKNEKK